MTARRTLDALELAFTTEVQRLGGAVDGALHWLTDLEANWFAEIILNGIDDDSITLILARLYIEASNRTDARAEIERLRKLLRQDHSGECAALLTDVPCNCGWDDNDLAKAEAEIEQLQAVLAHCIVLLEALCTKQGVLPAAVAHAIADAVASARAIRNACAARRGLT